MDFPANKAKFDEVRALDLPLGEYAITSSGPLGVRNIREIGDVDLIVSDVLWQQLATTYPQTTKGEFTLLTISPNIEALGNGSIMTGSQSGPSIDEQIEQAEMINGLPFVKLETILYFKRLMNRPKDIADIIAIEKLLR